MAWQSTKSPPEVGRLVELLCGDALGSYEVPGMHFLHDDGRWYLVDPPTLIEARVIGWRLPAE